MPLDEGLRPKRGKVTCLLHGIIFKENIDGLNQEMKLKEELTFWSTILEGRVPTSREVRV